MAVSSRGCKAVRPGSLLQLLLQGLQSLLSVPQLSGKAEVVPLLPLHSNISPLVPNTQKTHTYVRLLSASKMGIGSCGRNVWIQLLFTLMCLIHTFLIWRML